MSETLPAGWVRVPLSDVAEVRLGRQRSPSKAAGPNMRPYLRAANVTWQGISVVDVKEMDFSRKEFPIYELRDGDILLSEASGSASEVGKPAIWRGEVAGACFQNTLIRVRSKGPLPEYLHLHFFADAKLGRFAAFGKGSGINHLGAERMASWPTLVPPIQEQQRIVAKVRSQRESSGRARAALDAVPPLLEKLRQSILAAAFRGDLTKDWRAKNKNVEPASVLLARIRAERRKTWEQSQMAKMKAEGKVPTNDKWMTRYGEPIAVDGAALPDLPVGWCWSSLDELLAEGLANGRSVLTDDAGFPVLRLNALRKGMLDLTQRKGGAWSAQDAHPYLIRGGDFLVSRGNGSLALVGRGGLVPDDPDPVAFPDTLIRVRPHSLVQQRYLAAAWSGPFIRKQLELAAKTTAGIFKLSQSDLERVAIPVCSISEQVEIAARVARSLRKLDSFETMVQEVGRSERTLEQAILSKAFTGAPASA